MAVDSACTQLTFLITTPHLSSPIVPIGLLTQIGANSLVMEIFGLLVLVKASVLGQF